MKKLYSLPGLVLSILFLTTTFFFVAKSYDASQQFRVEKSKIAEILNFNDRLLSARDWIFTEDAWAEKKAAFETTMERADGHLFTAQTYGVYIIYASLIFLVIITVMYFKKRLFFGITMGLSFIAMALLGQGIMNPILEMSAYKEDLTIQFYVEADEIPYYEEGVEFLDGISNYIGLADQAIAVVKLIPYSEDYWADDLEDFVNGYREIVIDGKNYLIDNRNAHVGIDKVFPGKTYFYYQNKGIMEVISMLWKTDNKPVSIAIGLFSVIIPLLKLISTLLILILPVFKAKKFRSFLSFISKFSMADVFVIAAFLAFLSFSNMSPGVTMDATILFGLYYFFGYVIISIFLGMFLKFSIKEKERNLALELTQRASPQNTPET